MKKLIFLLILPIILMSCSKDAICYKCITSVDAEIVMIENRCMTEEEMSDYILKTEKATREANPRVAPNLIQTNCKPK